MTFGRLLHLPRPSLFFDSIRLNDSCTRSTIWNEIRKKKKKKKKRKTGGVGEGGGGVERRGDEDGAKKESRRTNWDAIWSYEASTAELVVLASCSLDVNEMTGIVRHVPANSRSSSLFDRVYNALSPSPPPRSVFLLLHPPSFSYSSPSYFLRGTHSKRSLRSITTDLSNRFRRGERYPMSNEYF